MVSLVPYEHTNSPQEAIEQLLFIVELYSVQDSSGKLI